MLNSPARWTIAAPPWGIAVLGGVAKIFLKA